MYGFSARRRYTYCASARNVARCAPVYGWAHRMLRGVRPVALNYAACTVSDAECCPVYGRGVAGENRRLSDLRFCRDSNVAQRVTGDLTVHPTTSDVSCRTRRSIRHLQPYIQQRLAPAPVHRLLFINNNGTAYCRWCTALRLQEGQVTRAPTLTTSVARLWHQRGMLQRQLADIAGCCCGETVGKLERDRREQRHLLLPSS